MFTGLTWDRPTLFNGEALPCVVIDEQFPADSVQTSEMNDTPFPIEFIGGSQDGAVAEATAAPDHLQIVVGDVKEIYERQNSEPPFVYVQIGYAGNEKWK